MESFLREVKERYQDRYVIIDATPSQITSEAKVLSEFVDGIILVVMAQKSPKKAVERTIQKLGKDKILGVVFNGYNKARNKYGKYYEYYGTR